MAADVPAAPSADDRPAGVFDSAGLVLVLAKAPVPGRAKTRLTPPCTPEAAAALAEASLHDTLRAVEEWGGGRLLVLDRCGSDFELPGWDVVPQPEGDLGVRLDAAFEAAFARQAGPAFLIGMDTPQIRSSDLRDAFAALTAADVDVVLGPADDGGFWGIGFRAYVPGAFDGVGMSRSDTGRQQHDRLRSLGCRVRVLGSMTDIDTFDEAASIGGQWPQTAVGALVGGPDWWSLARPCGYFDPGTGARSSA